MLNLPTPVLLTQALLDCALRLRAVLHRQVSSIGLTEAQWRVMSYIKYGNGLNQTQLALLLGIAKAPLGEILDSLQAQGLIERLPHASDRRNNRVLVSKAGEQVVLQLTDLISVVRDQLQQNVDPQFIEQLQARLLILTSLVATESVQQALAQIDAPSNLHLLGIAARHLAASIRRELLAHDLTVNQWRLLLRLLDNSTVDQKQLGLDLNIAKAPLGKTIARLEQQQWLLRSVPEHDRRARCLHLTDSGRDRMQQFHAALEKGLIPLEQFNQSQTTELLASLTWLQQQLESYEEQSK